MHLQFRSNQNAYLFFDISKFDQIMGGGGGSFYSLPYPPSQTTAPLTSWGNTLEVDLPANQSFFVVDKTTNVTTSDNAYLGLYPIQPFIQTFEEDTFQLTYSLRTFMPWEKIFRDQTYIDSLVGPDDDGLADILANACLSDIIAFKGPIGNTTQHANAPTWSVPITPDNADNNYTGLSVSLSTDMNTLKIAFPDFNKNYSKYIGGTTKDDSEPKTYTDLTAYSQNAT